MGSNSIRSNLDKDDIISEITLLKNADQVNENVYLVLEGKEDYLFIHKRLFNRVELFESFSGCLGVREIVEHFSDSCVIGICDRDHDIDYTNEFIFFYDFCCMEMMIINNNEVFKGLCDTCYDGELEPLALKNYILEDLKFISFLRKINFENSLGINFRGLSIKKSYNIQTNKIDSTLVIKSLNADILSSNRSRIAELNSEINTYEKLLNITNGHDFRNYLQVVFAINKPIGTKEISSNYILTMLLSGFRESDFMKTRLYSSLKCFEDAYSKKIIN